MARPIKHNADYFSHDSDMRNDLKIKALRRKFSHTGYAIWNMLLELITNSDYFEYEWSEMNIELLTPDFDIDADELKAIVEYCIKLNLLQLTNGYLHCDTLSDRLEEEVLARRKGYCKENAKRFGLMLQQPTINEVNVDINNVNVDINTQSKVKESKLKEIKVNETKQNFSKQELAEDTLFDFFNSTSKVNLNSFSIPTKDEINSLDDIFSK